MRDGVSTIRVSGWIRRAINLSLTQQLIDEVVVRIIRRSLIHPLTRMVLTP